MRLRQRLALGGALVAALTCTVPAAASPAKPVELHVAGGDGWHADNRFELGWTNPATTGSPLVATHYRLRDPLGLTIEERRIAWVSDGIAGLTVPKVPGSYVAEVWLEDAAGEQGPAAAAPLRFDDARPAPVESEAVAGWIGRTSFPLRLRLRHPAGPLPASGIRGYAVTIDSSGEGAPCAAADRCSEAETTLPGGAGDDELQVPALPEGTSYLHAVTVSGSGMKSALAGTAAIRVDTTDPVTQLQGVPPGWTHSAVRLIALASDTGSGMEPSGAGSQPFTAIRVDDGAPEFASGGAVATTLIDEGIHRIAYYARDAAGNVDDGAMVNGVADRRPRTASVRIDRTAPRLAFANAQDPSDPDLVRARVADQLSGPDQSRGRIGVRRVGSGDRFELLPAMPSADGELRARWESDAFPEGEYEFRATGYDLAGNASATTRRQNGAAMVLANPLKTTTALRAGFHLHGPRRTIPYGRRILLDGRLTAGRASPLGGVPVRVVERFPVGVQPGARTWTAGTAQDGTISLRLPTGPSRSVSLAFSGSPTLARSAGPVLEMRVRSGVRLRASSMVAEVGGAPLVFNGRLLAEPGVSARGRAVQLQFRLPGAPWAEFRTLQTDSRGRFRYAYRFSDDDSRGARFQFRAYVPAQESWPYEPGGSRPALVRGR
jgi:hypothetical protein